MNPEFEKILLAVVAGAIIGIEREFRDKAAGFRTLMFICLGTCVFTMLSATYSGGDPSRIAAGLVTGIGFIGTGVILHNRGQVLGLTTAALIWVTAAIGMCIGLGQYQLALATLIVTLGVLWLFPLVEFNISNQRQVVSYSFSFKNDPNKLANIRNIISLEKFKVLSENYEKHEKDLTYNVELVGTKRTHLKFNLLMIEDKDINKCTIL